MDVVRTFICIDCFEIDKMAHHLGPRIDIVGMTLKRERREKVRMAMLEMSKHASGTILAMMHTWYSS